jgi:hypothetical protein
MYTVMTYSVIQAVCPLVYKTSKVFLLVLLSILYHAKLVQIGTTFVICFVPSLHLALISSMLD